jgi:uncharacterized membrane protein YeaQ/YmgE (transglycosylase-associated protein family)
MNLEDILIFLVVGLLAGLVASALLGNKRPSLLGVVILGCLGSLLGGFLANILGIAAYGILAKILVSAAGAMVLVWLLRFVK